MVIKLQIHRAIKEKKYDIKKSENRYLVSYSVASISEYVNNS